MKKELICSIVLMLPFVSACASPLIANLEQDKGLVQASSDDAVMRQTAAGAEADFAALPEPPPPPEIIPLPPRDVSVGMTALAAK